MQKEELMLQKRLIELSKIAYQRGIVTYSDFLNLNELNILHTTPKSELYSNYETFGGYEFSERQMAVFLPDALCYEKNYPISVLKIEPLQKKFSEKKSFLVLSLAVDLLPVHSDKILCRFSDGILKFLVLCIHNIYWLLRIRSHKHDRLVMSAVINKVYGT